MAIRCLIVDKMHPSLVPLLADIGVEGVYRPEYDRQQIIDAMDGYQGLIIRSKTTIDKELLSKANDLRFIGRAGAGLDNINIEEVEALGVKILNAPEGNRDALAEHTIGMMLSLLNNFPRADRQVRQRNWQREANRGEELGDKVVGLLGYGNMGMAVAKRLKAFGCRVLAYDKYKAGYGDNYAKEVALEVIFEEADIFSIHVPLTGETEAMLDEDFLQKFQKPIFLINTARGEILSLKALEYCLRNNIIRAAALDVLENERLDELTESQAKTFEFLVESDNMLFTPHIAGWSHQSYARINEVLVEKISQEIA